MEKELSYCIWGCGIRGKNIYRYLGGKGVRAYIDQNPALWGTRCNGVPVISFEEYLEKHRDCIVISTPFAPQFEVKCKLDQHGVQALYSVHLPPELFEIYVPDLLELVELKFESCGTVYLYGLNLYSILLYDHCREKGRRVMLIPEQGCPPWLIQAISRSRPGSIGELENVGESCLYLTSSAYLNDALPAIRVKSIFDLMPDIKEYYNPELEEFRGIHKGKRCFIVATGPSLRIEDLDRLHQSGEICISMNGIMKAYGKTRWRPDYYLIEDMYCFQEWRDELLGDGRIKHMLVADACRPDPADREFIRYHVSFLPMSMECWPGFSHNFAAGAYHGMTVTYDCLQFAFYLGCSEIYLYGLDYNYSRQYNHFTTDYLEAEKHGPLDQDEMEDNLMQMQAGYMSAQAAGLAQGVKIFNASRQTKLDVFQRVDFDGLF